MKSLNTPILIHTVLLGLTISVDYFVGSVISLNLYELSTLIAYLTLEIRDDIMVGGLELH